MSVICFFVNGCTQPKSNEDILTTSKIETFNIIIPVQDTRFERNPDAGRHKCNFDFLISVNTETEEIVNIELSQETLELCPMTEEEFSIFWHRELEYIESEATPTDAYSDIRVEFYGRLKECNQKEDKVERIGRKAGEWIKYLVACFMAVTQ